MCSLFCACDPVLNRLAGKQKSGWGLVGRPRVCDEPETWDLKARSQRDGAPGRQTLVRPGKGVCPESLGKQDCVTHAVSLLSGCHLKVLFSRYVNVFVGSCACADLARACAGVVLSRTPGGTWEWGWEKLLSASPTWGGPPPLFTGFGYIFYGN